MRVRIHGRARAGFTLIEIVIGVLLFSGMMLVSGFAADRTLWMFRQRRAEEDVASRANRLLQRLAKEFTFARRAALAPEPSLGSETLTFSRCEGAEGGAATWGPSRTIRWEYEPGELDDGLDNDGNGLVDEGRVVWIENPGQPGESSVVWEHGLAEYLAGEEFNGDDDNGNGLDDEHGLVFSIEGDVLTIRLTKQGIGPNKNLITKTVQTSVFIRN